MIYRNFIVETIKLFQQCSEEDIYLVVAKNLDTVAYKSGITFYITEIRDIERYLIKSVDKFMDDEGDGD